MELLWDWVRCHSEIINNLNMSVEDRKYFHQRAEEKSKLATHHYFQKMDDNEENYLESLDKETDQMLLLLHMPWYHSSVK